MKRRIAVLLAATLSLGSAAHAQGPADRKGAGGEYKFSQDFVARVIPVWTEIFAPYKGKQNLRYLEVGVFEGRSFVWMLDNILTDPSSEAWAVDLFHRPFYGTFLKNVLAGKHALKTKIRRGDSRAILPTLPVEYFDIIYIDGNHEGQYVLSDAVMAWQLLKDRGLLVFDDYRFDLRVGRPFPEHHLPGAAIDAFVSIYVEDVEIVHDGYQKALSKRLSGCTPIGCSAFGQYRYQWLSAQLTQGSEDEPVELSDAEREALETFLRSRLPGETRFSPSPDFLSSGAWRDLSARLQIRNLDALIVSADEVRERRSRKPDDSY